MGVVLLVAGGIFAPLEAQYGNGYSYRREFDVVDALVIGGPHTNFPVIVSDSLDELRTTANGGRVQNANGYDIIFTSDAAGTNQLAHEIETYSATTGKFDMWVRVESLAATSKIYMFYGNSSIGSFQGYVTSNGASGVWDNDYQGVWHLNEATDATNVDATDNTNDGTPVGSPVSNPGQIGNALDFNVPGDATRVEVGSDPSLDVTLYTNFTMEAWVKPTSYGGSIKWPSAYGYGVEANLGLTVREARDPPFEGAIEFWMNDNTHEHSTTVATFNDWNHIAVVYTPTTLYFYMNGQPDGTAPAEVIVKSGEASFIGSDTIYPIEDDFLGLIDEVRFSGEIRSAGWIETQFNNQSSPSGFFATGRETHGDCTEGWVCWDGEGGTNNWSEAANWTGDIAPASTDSVQFLDLSTKNATVNATSTVAALTIDTGYSGTVTLAAGLTNDGDFTQNGGTLDLSGQTFTQRGDDWIYTAGTTPTDGTVVFDDATYETITVTGSHSLPNVTVNAVATPVQFNIEVAAGDTLTVNGTYTHQGTKRIDIETGDIHAKGDVTLSNTVTGGTGSGTLTINGAGTQNLTGGAALRQARVENIVIDKATGTLNLFQNINVRGTWTYVQGTIDPGTSTLVLTHNAIITGSHTLANLNLNNRGGADRTVTIAGGTTLTTTGTVTIAGQDTYSITLDGGDLHAQGDVVITNTGTNGGGTATITMNGTGAQALTGPGTAGQGKLPNLTIDKSAGSVTLTGHPTVAGTLTITQGELAHDTAGINSLTVEAATAVSIAAAGTWTNHSTTTSTVTLGGTVANAGVIAFDATAGTCGDADVILLRSSASPTQRLWSGAGTFGFIDVDVQDQAGSAAITVRSGTNSGGNGGNWTFSICQFYATTVNPDTAAADGLPSNGTNYTVDFTVVNDGNGTDDFDLFTSETPGTVLSVVSMTGTGVTQDADPDSARVANVAAGDSVAVTVTYSIADVAAGTTDTLFFTARSVTEPDSTDGGRLEVTVVRPNLITSKAVNPNGTLTPGIDLTYTVTFTNNGSEAADSVMIVDSLATEVEFKVGTVVNNLPGGIGVVVQYSNDNGGSWTYTPVSTGCSAPANYDRCVTHIRWILQNPLGYTGPDNTGDVQFVTRIR